MRISSKKHVGLQMADSAGSTTIDEKLTANYNDRIIDYALKLKAQNGSKYSDEYYLNYAKNIYSQEMTRRLGESNAKRAANCPIQDPQWRGYSYEEIINLENNGYKIPEDVLLWAHAQQESDIVAYEVISSEAETDDNTSTENITGDNDLNNLQKKAKKYTTQAEKTEVEIKENIANFNEEKNNLTIKKQNSKNAYENAINEISNITKEWKELEQKNQKGLLTANEEIKFKNLSKILGNKTNELESIKVDSNDIDSLINSMKELKTSTSKNNELTDNIDKATSDLANFDKNYNSEQKTYNTSGIVYSGNGLLSNLLFGIDSSAISSVAFNTSNELSILSTDSLNTLETINSKALNPNVQNSNLTQTQTPTQTPKINKQANTNEKGELQQNSNIKNNKNENTKTENSVTENSEENSNTNEIQKGTTTNKTTTLQHSNDSNNKNTSNNSTYKSNQNSIYRDEIYKNAVYKTLNKDENNNKKEEEDKKKKNPDFFVLPVGGRPELAILAAATSAASTANLNGQKDDTNKTEAKLKKDLNKTNSKIKKLEKQIENVEKKHAENLRLAEQHNAQLEILMAEEEAKQIEAANNTQTKNAENQAQIGNENSEEPKLSPAITSTLDAMNRIYDNDQIMMINMAKPIAKAKSEINVNDKTAKRLNEQNRSLEDRNSNNKKVQRNTIISGSMTTAVGAYNMAVAVPMLKTGTALLSNPFTAATGAAMVAFATKWIIIGSLQLSVGPIAVAAGGIGLGASKEATDEIKTHNKTYSDAVKSSQQNKKSIRLATNAMTQAEPTIIPELKPSNNKKKQENNIQEDNNPKFATSKTQTMEFKDVKDITKMPQGPTNLSNPLNKPKSKANQETKPLENNTLNDKKENQNINVKEEPQKVATTNTNSKKSPILESTQPIDKPSIENKTQNKKVDEILNKNVNKITSNNQQLTTLNKTVQKQELKEKDDNEITKINDTTDENVNSKSNEINKILAMAKENVKEDETTQKAKENEIDKQAEVEARKEVQEEKQKEDKRITANIQAASATANANVKANILTDDKADRKLTRFNMDSIIESKKKQKKVLAISSTYTGKRS